MSLYGFDEGKAEEIHDLIEDTLSLFKPTEEDARKLASLPAINEIVWRIYDKLEELINKIVNKQETNPERLKAFVSFRFNDHGKALAFELREFLELTKVEFVSGLGFEPRSVSEKVIEKLSSPLDLFIIIQCVSGDSAWVNQEIGIAKANKIPVIVLKEEGAAETPGILGDIEYLPFSEGNISNTYVGILQAISYIHKNASNNCIKTNA